MTDNAELLKSGDVTLLTVESLQDEATASAYDIPVDFEGNVFFFGLPDAFTAALVGVGPGFDSTSPDRSSLFGSVSLQEFPKLQLVLDF